ncbi:MAG: hypothetical protein Q8L74_00465 [Nitrospirota bacterium]|nr:hypothetical protein [Nitrospirota bacterium]
MRYGWSTPWILAIALLTVMGCATGQLQEMLDHNDHAGLASYYQKEAEMHRGKAKQWDQAAQYYEQHRDPHGKLEPAQHAAHCRALAEIHRRAAVETDALAADHQAMISSSGGR